MRGLAQEEEVAMIDHTGIGVADVGRSAAFYDAEAGPLRNLFGQVHLFCFYLFIHLPPNEVENAGCVGTGKALLVWQLGEPLDQTLGS